MGEVHHHYEAPQDAFLSQTSDNADLLRRLDLPKEVSTQQAAEILGCCKHTILQFVTDGVLEWRNAAPPSSNRPVYRFTLRSVLEIRLGYQRGGVQPALPVKPIKNRSRPAPKSNYQPQHLRRKKSTEPGDN